MPIKRKTFMDSINARLVLTVLIAENGRIPMKIKGYASSYALKTDIQGTKKRALQNALFKYISQKQDIPEEIYNSGKWIESKLSRVRVKIVDFHVLYFDYKFLRLKRENWNGKYVNTLRSKKTGEFISWNKWKSRKPKELFKEDELDELGTEPYEND